MRRTPVLIVGGGPAGCAAAITLARGGIRPELIERTTGPHDVVCGGFVGWDSIRILESLGIDLAALGAKPIGRVRLVAGRREVEAALPRAAAGVSRRALDSALIAAAAAAGARVRRGLTVREADAERRVVRCGADEVACDALFLATGKHELRGAPRARPASAPEPAVGLRTSLPATPELARALAGFVELHLLEGAYAGLLLQEDGSANLCLSVSRRRLTSAGGIEALLDEIAHEAPILAQRLGPGFDGRFDAIAGVPYGWRTRQAASGAFRVGDQAAVIASLAGDGIAIALASGRGAARALIAGGPAAAAEWQLAFRDEAKRPLRTAETLRYAAEHRWLRGPLLHILGLVPALARGAALLTRIDRG